MSFDLKQLLRNNIREIAPYSTARDEFQGKASVFLDANESPFQSDINRYPDPYQQMLKVRVSRIKKVHPDQIFLGNGSDEAIDLVIRAFCEPHEDNILAIKPTYGMYKVAADINAVTYREVMLTRSFNLDVVSLMKSIDKKTKVVFLCSPNNPSGNSLIRSNIEYVLNNFEGIVVIDEAYIDFAREEGFLPLLNSYPNLIVLQTFSKAWGMAGVRLGMAFASKEIIQVLNHIKYPYNVNVLTQQKALEILEQEEQTKQNISTIISERDILLPKLNNLDVIEQVYPTDANFVLVRVKDPKAVYNYLLNKEIIVRDRSKVALCEGCLRLTIGTPEENLLLLDALANFK